MTQFVKALYAREIGNLQPRLFSLTSLTVRRPDKQDQDQGHGRFVYNYGNSSQPLVLSVRSTKEQAGT